MRSYTATILSATIAWKSRDNDPGGWIILG